MPDKNPMSADEMQSRMAQLRQDLQSDVSRTAAAAKQLTDWRYYFRQFPWASAAAIAGIGFLAVPKKRERPVVDEAALKQMISEKRVVVIPQKADMAKKSLLGSLVGLLGTSATRIAMNYATQKLSATGRPIEDDGLVRLRTPK